MRGESFEEATEFGVPTALREPADYLRLGYNFHDYDKSLRATGSSCAEPRRIRSLLK
jgi:hypothetical protein